METLLFFMSGFTLGIAMTYTYFDSKARRERMEAVFVKIKSMNNNE
jgi:hypothetical protein